MTTTKMGREPVGREACLQRRRLMGKESFVSTLQLDYLPGWLAGWLGGWVRRAMCRSSLEATGSGVFTLVHG